MGLYRSVVYLTGNTDVIPIRFTVQHPLNAVARKSFGILKRTVENFGSGPFLSTYRLNVYESGGIFFPPRLRGTGKQNFRKFDATRASRLLRVYEKTGKI